MERIRLKRQLIPIQSLGFCFEQPEPQQQCVFHGIGVVARPAPDLFESESGIEGQRGGVRGPYLQMDAGCGRRAQLDGQRGKEAPAHPAALAGGG